MSLVMGRFHVPPTLVRLGARQVSRRAFDPSLPWAVQRRRLDRLVRSWPLRRGTLVEKTALNGVRAEVVTATAAPRVTVVHFHGGGYCVGSPAEARDWAAYLSARAECRTILPDYRLAPEHPYPAALEDARAVLRAVLAETEPGSVVVSGDSAGGGLALIVARGPLAWTSPLPGGRACGTTSPCSPTCSPPPTPRSPRPPASSGARQNRGQRIDVIGCRWPQGDCRVARHTGNCKPS